MHDLVYLLLPCQLLWAGRVYPLLEKHVVPLGVAIDGLNGLVTNYKVYNEHPVIEDHHLQLDLF